LNKLRAFSLFLAYSPAHLSDAIFLWVLSTKVGYMATSIFRQEDRDVEHGSSNLDMPEKISMLVS
jgi:hypothetical protein